MVTNLLDLPSKATEVFERHDEIRRMAAIVAGARDVLYLGRGAMFPVALEGALKLKEITYIHAEAYAAGEMKHGPISLIDSTVPVVATVPSGPLFEKTLSNLQEAKARGGRLLVFTDMAGAPRLREIAECVVAIPTVDEFVAPILQTIPVQILCSDSTNCQDAIP